MYVCSSCGAQFTKWSGKCSYCNQWGTLEEVKDNTNSKISAKKGNVKSSNVISLKKVSVKGSGARLKSEINEFDRVLGGGFVAGSVTLIGGEPGIGKSTLVSQVMLNLSEKGKKILYISAEESVGQVKQRFERLAHGNKGIENIFIIDDPIVENFLSAIESEQPDLVIIDSIQAIYSLESDGLPGGISQIKTSGVKLVSSAKSLNIPFVVVGQITKSGLIAGPKILEHSVDTVLTMTGEQNGFFRLLRATKNRFGSTQEIGVFRMESKGLIEVEDAGRVFVNGSVEIPGTAIGAVVEGSRVLLVEVQTLVVEKKFEGVPVRRIANGIKKQRLDILSAVLTKRAGIYLGDKDIFLNVSSGLNIDNPSLDLAIISSIISAVKNVSIPSQTVFLGEVSLTGEVKKVFGSQRIVSEVKRLGFDNIISSSELKPLFVKGLNKIIN